MSDAFVPEADRLDQDREVVEPPVSYGAEEAGHPIPAVPPTLPVEASEADVWEQMQEVDDGEADYP